LPFNHCWLSLVLQCGQLRWAAEKWGIIDGVFHSQNIAGTIRVACSFDGGSAARLQRPGDALGSSEGHGVSFQVALALTLHNWEERIMTPPPAQLEAAQQRYQCDRRVVGTTLVMWGPYGAVVICYWLVPRAGTWMRRRSIPWLQAGRWRRRPQRR